MIECQVLAATFRRPRVQRIESATFVQDTADAAFPSQKNSTPGLRLVRSYVATEGLVENGRGFRARGFHKLTGVRLVDSSPHLDLMVLPRVLRRVLGPHLRIWN